MESWSIRTKLSLLAGLGLVLLVVLGSVTWWSLRQMENATGAIHATTSALRNHLDADMMHDALRGDVLAALLATPDQEADVRKDLDEHAERFRKMITENEGIELAPAVTQALAEAKPALETYIAKADKIVALAFENREAAKAAFPDFTAAFSTLEGRMEQLSNLIEDSAGKSEARGLVVQRQAKQSTLAVGLLGVLMLNVGALLVTRSIVRPLTRTVEVLERVAAGDLTPRLSIASKDEVGRMATSLNRTLDAMNDMIGRIAENATSLLAASGELSDVSAALRQSAAETSDQSTSASSSAEEISASIQNVAAATHEMTASIQEIARNAGEASKIAARAVDTAASTDEVMRRLDSTSGEIGTAIQSIRLIAEQTDTLARSASAQAAKVAEAGAGFAIVAQEVKTLARETGRATETITQRLAVVKQSSSDANDTVAQIGGVVKVIGSLAAQTNLLALNATIEAGRAGAAGGGVGEMARGVKDLANQTANATAGISDRAVEIRQECLGASAAVSQIVQVVREVRDIQDTIARAVEGQQLATQQISRNVEHISIGGTEIARLVSDVAAGASATSAGATRTGHAADQLSKMATGLSGLVAGFTFTATDPSPTVAPTATEDSPSDTEDSPSETRAPVATALAEEMSDEDWGIVPTAPQSVADGPPDHGEEVEAA